MSDILNIDECGPSCPLPCATVFKRVVLRPGIQQTTTIEWTYAAEFGDPELSTAQLQVGMTGSNLADDWQDVGLPAANTIYLVDTEQRAFGKTQFTHYRIKLVTANGTYYSEPVSAYGSLPQKYWRIWKNRFRQYYVALSRTSRGNEGFLLKRKLHGNKVEPGMGITDFLTEEVTNPDAPETVGTEYEGGYYDPIPCVFADVSELNRREELDDGRSRGTVNDRTTVSALMLAVPQIDSRDVWVSKTSDQRFMIQGIRSIEDLDGIDIVVSAEFRLLPFTHPVYAIPMPA
jgi:hypothetical protein